MTLLGLIMLLVVVGLILYIVPMEPAIKDIITKVVVVVVIVSLVYFVLQAFGVTGRLQQIRIGP